MGILQERLSTNRSFIFFYARLIIRDEAYLGVVEADLLHDGLLGFFIFKHHCLLIGRPILQEQVQQVALQRLIDKFYIRT